MVTVSRRKHNKLSLCKKNCMMGANPIPNFEMEGKEYRVYLGNQEASPALVEEGFKQFHKWTIVES